MGIFHFLDVGQGDCSIIEHVSGRVTMIDVCKARSVKAKSPFAPALANALAGPDRSRSLAVNALFGPTPPSYGAAAMELLGRTPSPFAPSAEAILKALATPDYVNPIAYMKARNITDLFRYIQSHTDMDHMDGLVDLFAEFPLTNFWDTTNTCKKDEGFGYGFRREDWERYKSIRDGTAVGGPRRLVLYPGSRGAYYNEVSQAGEMHDGLYVLAPTPELVNAANQSQDFNDCSYVVLWISNAGRILFCGDSHDKTWEYIGANFASLVERVEIMIAPHHGRDSGRDRTFLDIVKPKLTLFGRAPSEHLAYDAWSNRGLAYITNNQCDTIIVDASKAPMFVYATKEAYARKRSPNTWFSKECGGWYLGYIG